MEELENAGLLDELHEWQYTGKTQDYLLSLLRMSNYCEKARKWLEFEINDTSNMNKDNYDKIVFKLFQNQLDPVSSGFSYKQWDIIHHLRKLK